MAVVSRVPGNEGVRQRLEQRDRQSFARQPRLEDRPSAIRRPDVAMQDEAVEYASCVRAQEELTFDVVAVDRIGQRVLGHELGEGRLQAMCAHQLHEIASHLHGQEQIGRQRLAFDVRLQRNALVVHRDARLQEAQPIHRRMLADDLRRHWRCGILTLKLSELHCREHPARVAHFRFQAAISSSLAASPEVAVMLEFDTGLRSWLYVDARAPIQEDD